ncbi:MAG: hypothetical protein ACI8QC_001171 [Planctomycetota bacterium]
MVRYCGLVTDPVTKQRFRPRDDGPRYEYEKVTYLFVDQDSYEALVADPERHVLPGFSM